MFPNGGSDSGGQKTLRVVEKRIWIAQDITPDVRGQKPGLGVAEKRIWIAQNITSDVCGQKPDLEVVEKNRYGLRGILLRMCRPKSLTYEIVREIVRDS